MLVNPTSKPRHFSQNVSESVNRKKTVANLRKLITCPTVSFSDPLREDDAAFDRLLCLLPSLYPNVYKNAELLINEKRGLLFRIKGKHHNDKKRKVSVFMAHFDVVPADQTAWKKDPFAGIIENGVLWGRGAIDTKPTFNGILTAADELLSEGFMPTDDIYMAFSGMEEIHGPAANHLADYFRKNHIPVGLVLDEGGAVASGAFPGMKKKAAFAGTGEKGFCDLTLTAAVPGGHASAPERETSVTILCDAVMRLNKSPFSMRLQGPTAQLFKTLGRETSFFYRIFFANLSLFSPLLDWVSQKKGGELNSLLRTTVAFTQMEGSSAANILPTHARVRCNVRISPGDTVSSVIQRMKRIIDDDRITISLHGSYGIDPSPVSKTDCDSFKKVSQAIVDTWGKVTVSPYLMVQCSDSRFYADLSDEVYRFSAQELSSDERRLIHGDNERITLKQVIKAALFFKRLMRMC